MPSYLGTVQFWEEYQRALDEAFQRVARVAAESGDYQRAVLRALSAVPVYRPHTQT